MNTKADLLIEFLQTQFDIKGSLFDKSLKDANTQTARQLFTCLAMQNEFFSNTDGVSVYERLRQYLIDTHHYTVSLRMIAYMYVAAVEKADDSRSVEAKFKQAERFVRGLSTSP